MTKPITYEETHIEVPLIVAELLQRGQRPIFTYELQNMIRLYWERNDVKKSISPDRIRIMINHIRRNEILPVMSGNKGYWLAKEKSECILMAELLEMRCSAITAAASGLRSYAKKIK
jgi:hypothetical protein